MLLCVEPVRGLRNALLFGYFDAITHFSHNISTTKTPERDKEEKKERRAAKTARYVFWNLIWAPRLLRVAECGMCARVGLNVRRLYIRRANCTHTPIESSKRACQLGMAGCLHIYTGLALCTQRLRHTSTPVSHITKYTGNSAAHERR